MKLLRSHEFSDRNSLHQDCGIHGGCDLNWQAPFHGNGVKVSLVVVVQGPEKLQSRFHLFIQGFLLGSGELECVHEGIVILGGFGSRSLDCEEGSVGFLPIILKLIGEVLLWYLLLRQW